MSITLIQLGHSTLPVDKPGTFVSIRLSVNPRDFWVGFYAPKGGKSGWYWSLDREYRVHNSTHMVYICLLPMLPLCVKVLRQWKEAPYQNV